MEPNYLKWGGLLSLIVLSGLVSACSGQGESPDANNPVIQDKNLDFGILKIGDAMPTMSYRDIQIPSHILDVYSSLTCIDVTGIHTENNTYKSDSETINLITQLRDVEPTNLENVGSEVRYRNESSSYYSLLLTDMPSGSATYYFFQEYFSNENDGLYLEIGIDSANNINAIVDYKRDNKPDVINQNGNVYFDTDLDGKIDRVTPEVNSIPEFLEVIEPITGGTIGAFTFPSQI